MKQIKKHILYFTGAITLSLPNDATILHVEYNEGAIVIFVEFDNDWKYFEDRKFVVFTEAVTLVPDFHYHVATLNLVTHFSHIYEDRTPKGK